MMHKAFRYRDDARLVETSGRLPVTYSSIGTEKVEVAHTYYVKTSDAASEKEVEAFWDFYVEDHHADFEIWNHKIYRERPVLADGDGDVAGFRRWFRLFYSGAPAPGAARASAA